LQKKIFYAILTLVFTTNSAIKTETRGLKGVSNIVSVKVEVKPKYTEGINFNISMGRDTLCTLKNINTFKEVDEVANSELYWNIFQRTGSPVAYLLYKDEVAAR